jgi:hypothetical protein
VHKENTPMARDDSDNARDPERKRSAPGSERPGLREARAAAWAVPRRGRSGYGLESIRPHLRAQIEQQKLLRPTFPPEIGDDDDRPDPHVGRGGPR